MVIPARAMGRLAARWRRQFPGRLLAVTGSADTQLLLQAARRIKDRLQRMSLVKKVHLIADPGEKKDLAGEKAEMVAKMKNELDAWVRSCKDSLEGKDYR